jgi:hypothetical protein
MILFHRNVKQKREVNKIVKRLHDREVVGGIGGVDEWRMTPENGDRMNWCPIQSHLLQLEIGISS